MSASPRVYIDGLPGSGKHDLSVAVARELGVPAHSPDSELESLGGCDTPDALALWLTGCCARVYQPDPGVYVGSPETWPALFNTRFAIDSDHVCAKIALFAVATFAVPDEPTLRVLLKADTTEQDPWYDPATLAEFQATLETYEAAHRPLVLNPTEMSVDEMTGAIVEALASQPPAPAHAVPTNMLL